MASIEFKNLPDTSTPLTAENLNANFDELDNEISTLETSVSTINNELTGKMQFGNIGNNPNINNMRSQSGVFGLYNCAQAPSDGIGVLEVLKYSNDWCVQRFSVINQSNGSIRMWERSFYGGTTWSNWVQRW